MALAPYWVTARVVHVAPNQVEFCHVRRKSCLVATRTFHFHVGECVEKVRVAFALVLAVGLGQRLVVALSQPCSASLLVDMRLG